MINLPPIPLGLCGCGCGSLTQRSPKTRGSRGLARGEFTRFIRGHRGFEGRLMECIEPEPNTGCWLWSGCVNEHGYGLIGVHGRQSRAHRVLFEIFRGAVPDGLVLDHLCRVRCCVNPEHLEPVTNAENLRRGEGISATNARKTHCKHGHPFDEANTYLWRGSVRVCRTCNRQGYHKYGIRERRRQRKAGAL